MKNIGFIGAFDKLDLLLYISKILNSMKKKVIIIDTTLEQKSKYIVPVINPTKSYITRFENIDIAIGFQNYLEIERYIMNITSAPSEMIIPSLRKGVV